MLRRFAPFMVLALIVLASLGVFIIRAITANRDPCAAVFAALNHPFYRGGEEPLRFPCSRFRRATGIHQAHRRRQGQVRVHSLIGVSGFAQGQLR
jgi:hypothetical protein